MARISDWVSLTRDADRAFLAAVDLLRSLRSEYDASDFGTVLQDPNSGAFDGDNADVDADKMIAVIGPTLDNLNAFMAAGNATNMNAIR